MVLLSHLVAIDKNTTMTGPSHEFHKISKGNYSYFTDGNLGQKAHFTSVREIQCPFSKFRILFKESTVVFCTTVGT